MSAALIKELRARTGAGMLDCKNALAENDWNIDKAIDQLRAKGIAKAAKKSGRIAAEGVVEAYIHAGGRIGVLLELNCETDFVAIGEDFKNLARDIAMHIAAEAPQYVSKADVPEADIAAERRVQIAKAIEEGSPEHIAEKKVIGRMKKWFGEVVLLEQKFIKDDSKTINDLLVQAVQRIGENIKVRRFTRYVLGEGLEKRSDDFAAEVAAAVGG